MLAALVRGHRRKFPSDAFTRLPRDKIRLAIRLCVVLRLAVLLQRGRGNETTPEFVFRNRDERVELVFPEGWLAQHPLTEADLAEEQGYLEAAGIRLEARRTPRLLMTMPRELLILRHGKSDWASGADTDFDRPLAKRGRKAVKRIARWMRAQHCLPDAVVSSPALRARQTTHRLCRQAGLADIPVAWESTVYAADLEALLRILARAPEQAARVLLVGHNPGLEDLLRYLVDESTSRAGNVNPLPTAALAQLRMPADWRRLDPRVARLVRIIRPREL